MSNELWSAILNPSGPNYETWRKVLDSDQVPLQSPRSVKATLGEEKDVEVYKLDLAAMATHQRERLLGFTARMCGVDLDLIEREVAANGFPIRAVDVIVSISARAFL